MNGLDKPGVNNNGGEAAVEYRSTFYSYPEDIPAMKDKIDWILEDNHAIENGVIKSGISKIVPYIGHRFLIIDKDELVLSMYGTDIIYWAKNLVQGIANDIFSELGWKVNLENVDTNSFWYKKAD